MDTSTLSFPYSLLHQQLHEANFTEEASSAVIKFIHDVFGLRLDFYEDALVSWSELLPSIKLTAPQERIARGIVGEVATKSLEAREKQERARKELEEKKGAFEKIKVQLFDQLKPFPDEPTACEQAELEDICGRLANMGWISMSEAMKGTNMLRTRAVENRVGKFFTRFLLAVSASATGMSRKGPVQFLIQHLKSLPKGDPDVRLCQTLCAFGIVDLSFLSTAISPVMESWPACRSTFSRWL